MDARPAAPPRVPWREVPLVAAEAVTPRVRSLRLAVGWPSFRAGQHLDLRLTAPDGYRAQRSYSIASSPSDPGTVEVLVERLDEGEVSGFLHDGAEPGDLLETRGPFGGSFVWGPGDGGPLLLVGGGSGVAPLLAMLRHRAEAAPAVPCALLYAARTAGDVIARDELLARARAEPGLAVLINLSREADAPPWARAGRIGPARIAEALARLPAPPAYAFVCGSNPFVGAVADGLVAAGVDPAVIRTERFGG